MTTDTAARDVVKADGHASAMVDLLDQVAPLLDDLGLDRRNFVATLITQLNDNPDLRKCTPDSFVAAVYKTARLGLRTGEELGWCWLIPRRIKGTWQVTWMLGYKGMVELARRAGVTIRTGAVYPGDHFEAHEGTDPRLVHRHGPNHGEGEALRWYATAQLPDGTMMFRVLTRSQVEQRRLVSSSQKGAPSGFWGQHGYDRMARKTCIRALEADLPKGLSPDLLDAAEADGTVPSIRPTSATVDVDDDPDDAEDVEVLETVRDDVAVPDQLDEGLVLAITEWRHAAGLESDKSWQAWVASHCGGVTTLDQVDPAQARALLDATKARAEAGGGQ